MAAIGLGVNAAPAAAQVGDLARKYRDLHRQAPISGRDLLVRSLPTQIVRIADQMRNKKIGRGECTDFVIEVLKQAGAKPGDFGDYRNYVWGVKRIKRLGKGPHNWAAPGNIIQFEDCYFKMTESNGSWRDFNMPHHTAIVVKCTGSVVTILHQNAPLGGPVREDVLDLASKQRGAYKIWVPVPK
jgi:hypothetical protein